MTNSSQLRKQIETKAQKEGRLPPGQSLTIKFPVLHYGTIPSFDPERWRFRIWGEVEEELSWTWEEIQQLPRTQVTMDVHCVTRWSKLDNTWEGISIRYLIDAGILKIKPSAKYVIQHAENGYTTNLPLDIVLQENFLLAIRYEGEPLTPEHGFPLRAVIGAIPGRTDLKTAYFWKGAKWLRELEFSSKDKPGFWEQAGYNNEADIWKEQRFA